MKIKDFFEILSLEVKRGFENIARGRKLSDKELEREKDANYIVNTFAKALTELEDFRTKRVFFHKVDDQGNRMFFVLENGFTAILPVSSNCPIQILTPEGLKSDITEFIEKNNEKIVEILENKNEFMKKISEEID